MFRVYLSRARLALRWLALAYALLLIGLSLLHMLAPQRAGLLAVTQVFAPYLFLPLLPLLPFGLAGGVWHRLALAICSAIFLLRFAPPALPSPAAHGAGQTQISALTWNLYVGAVEPSVLRDLLGARPADIVALQEVVDPWIADDHTLDPIYPYRLAGRTSAPGIALLSRFPILAHGAPDLPDDVWDAPRVLWARLDLGAGQTLMVIAAHPVPPRTLGQGGTLTGYDPARRDAQIVSLRAVIDPLLAAGEPLLLMGDFNVTEREPAYADLTRGLADAQQQAGGPGGTWRPEPLHHLPVALLRIDYLLSGGPLAPVAASIDCTPRGSDHCAVTGRFVLR